MHGASFYSLVVIAFISLLPSKRVQQMLICITSCHAGASECNKSRLFACTRGGAAPLYLCRGRQRIRARALQRTVWTYHGSSGWLSSDLFLVYSSLLQYNNISLYPGRTWGLRHCSAPSFGCRIASYVPRCASHPLLPFCGGLLISNLSSG
jgi:hypothetical protein